MILFPFHTRRQGCPGNMVTRGYKGYMVRVNLVELPGKSQPVLESAIKTLASILHWPSGPPWTQC